MDSNDTFEIENKAKKIFESSVPASWIIRNMNPDIYIDYEIELRENKKPTGKVFAVQLKGTTIPKYSDLSISFRMEAKYLKYYLYNVTLPVFIVLVDVREEKGYWIFIQKHLREIIKDKKWENQKTFTFDIPIENDIKNFNHFHEEINIAITYMRDLSATSIGGVIKLKEQSIERVDPRFSISTIYKEGISYHILNPKEEVKFNLQFKCSDKLKKKVDDFITKGKKLDINSDQILKLNGSPIFDKILDFKKPGVLSLHPRVVKDISLTLSTFNVNKKITSVLSRIGGILTRGTKELLFNGRLNTSPLKLVFNYPIIKDDIKYKINFTFGFDPEYWERYGIMDLPYFEKIYNFFLAIVEGDNIKIEIDKKGNTLFETTIESVEGNPFIDEVFGHLYLLYKLRKIASFSNINPLANQIKNITREDKDNINTVYELLVHGEYSKNGMGVIFNFNIPPNKNELNKVTKNMKNPDPVLIKIKAPKLKFDILGNEIELFHVIYKLTKSETSIPLTYEEIQENLRTKKIIPVEIKGTKDSELFIRRYDENEDI